MDLLIKSSGPYLGRVLLDASTSTTTLVIGLFSVQANAALYELDIPTARLFTQLSTNSAPYDLQLVIDNPGTPGSTTYVDDGFHGSPADYGDTMQYAVGFSGSLSKSVTSGDDPELWIGKGFRSEFAVGDTLQIDIANDDDDKYLYTAWYSTDNLGSIVQGASILLSKDTTGLVSVLVGAAPTHFGFNIELDPGESSPDTFHTSVVPIPGAFLLGILGLGTAGLRLRRRLA